MKLARPRESRGISRHEEAGDNAVYENARLHIDARDRLSEQHGEGEDGEGED